MTRAGGWLVACACLLAACGAPPRRFESARPRMGTAFRVVVYSADAERAQAAIDAAYARIDALNAVLSDWDEHSELSRLSAKSDAGPAAPVQVSAELFCVLERAQAWAAQTDGAFDPTLGPLVALWRRSARQAELPAPDRLTRARAASGWEKLVLDPVARTVELRAPGMRLDLGGIAKGYAVDEALRVLADHGLHRALVDAGGDVAAGDPPPGAAGWRVALDPFGDGGKGGEARTLLLARGAVATSGDAFRAVEIDGVRYAHIVDPATGLGLRRRVGASVLAPDATTADALATACCVLDPATALALCARTPGVEARLLVIEGEERRAFESEGFAARSE